MHNHVMLDLETLATGANALVVAIGAVRFDDRTIIDSFYQTIDAEDAQRFGFDIDAGTFMWWLKQSDAARTALSMDTIDIMSALDGFGQWLGSFGDGDVCVWGNGSSFDNAILRNAYEVVGLECPWSWRNDRCYRTLKGMSSVEAPKIVGIHHNAFDDAMYQTKHLQDILSESIKL